VAGFGDAELFVGLGRLIAAGHEAEIRADVAGVGEVGVVLYGQHEAQGGNRADARDLAEAPGRRVAVVGEGFEFDVEGFDLGVERVDRGEPGRDQRSVWSGGARTAGEAPSKSSPMVFFSTAGCLVFIRRVLYTRLFIPTGSAFFHTRMISLIRTSRLA